MMRLLTWVDEQINVIGRCRILWCLSHLHSFWNKASLKPWIFCFLLSVYSFDTFIELQWRIVLKFNQLKYCSFSDPLLFFMPMRLCLLHILCHVKSTLMIKLSSFCWKPHLHQRQKFQMFVWIWHLSYLKDILQHKLVMGLHHWC